MTTRAGELSVKVDRLELLAKSMRPLPDKWHGLADPDTRFRQRYVDLVVNADARRAFDVRHEVIASFRRTFHERGFVEVETPVLHVEAGGAHARPFVTHYNTLDMPLYLRIALELHLKRLIVGGMDRVFEIGRVVPQRGAVAAPQPRVHDDGVLRGVRRRDRRDRPHRGRSSCRAARDALGTTVVDDPRRDASTSPSRGRSGGWSTSSATRSARRSTRRSPSSTLRALADDARRALGAAVGLRASSIEELFEATVEPGIVAPVFVTGHPVEISPLARVDRTDPFLTERFELFVDSRELANGYSELNDPVEQRLRFEDEQRARRTPATPSGARSTRTTCGRSSTACRRPAGSASASTGW